MSFAALIYGINIVLVFVVICLQRRDPIVSLAWALTFALFPIVGLIVFLIFGNGLKRKTAKRYLEKLDMNLDLEEKLNKSHAIKTLSTRRDDCEADMMLYLLNIGNSAVTENNATKIYTDADSKYFDLIEDIRRAKSTINMSYFIYRNDIIGKKIMKELVQKAQEGVEVRFLYDSIGCFTTDKYLFQKLKAAGGYVSAFFPVKLTSYSKLNHRNHRKIVVIDGKIGYLGGMNIGDEYKGLKRLRPWRDTHMRIEGEAVTYLQKVFALDWMFSTDEDLSSDLNKYFPRSYEPFGEKTIQIVAGGPDTEEDEIKCGMIKMINSAKDYIYIQSPYFVPDKPFLSALTMAAKSGRDVRLMIPGKPDKYTVYCTTYSFLGELLDAGVKVYKYHGFIHSKTIVMDNKISTIGTTNTDIRSFHLHFEVNAFVYDEKFAQENKRIFLKDIGNCDEITKREYDKRNIFKKFAEGFCRMFSPIM